MVNDQPDGSEPDGKTGSAVAISLVLTRREREIAELVAFGMSNKEIARQLALRHQTVRNILVQVFRKTSTRKRKQLAVNRFSPHTIWLNLRRTNSLAPRSGNEQEPNSIWVRPLSFFPGKTSRESF